MKYFLYILFFFLTGCIALNKHKEKGLYVRVINTSPVETMGYKIDKYFFPGLKQGDTSQYQFMKKFNSGDEKCAFLVGKISICSSILYCGKCDVDTVKYLTLRIGISHLNEKVPQIFYDK